MINLELKRRSFLQFLGLAGIAVSVPGLSIADVIPPNNVMRSGECKAFGEFLISVANGENARWSDGMVPVPQQFTKVLKGTIKEAGLLGKLKRDKITVLFYATEDLLEDGTAFGHFAWHGINESLMEHKMNRFNFVNSATGIMANASYYKNEQCFKFVIRAF